ncbi:MAG TPA: gamma-glutamyl-gamma-aminobutyrate hydrolase family protein [Methanotrichaceae archaeon]|nr:gamma-glutamyl-gamma-aminobutyrate hydrolase family protein [Methanotrichaceae archaeon]
MILICDLCYEMDSLSQYEFVYPIADTLKRAGAECQIKHYTEIAEDGPDDECRGIILCGTALKDNVYVEHMESFSWIRECKMPVLGICAGMQVIGLAFGGSILPQPAIGLKELEIRVETPLLGQPRQIEGYHLHNFGVTMPERFIEVAGKDGQVEAFKHGESPVYGIIFHPEVRNRWIVERFADMVD